MVATDESSSMVTVVAMDDSAAGGWDESSALLRSSSPKAEFSTDCSGSSTAPAPTSLDGSMVKQGWNRYPDGGIFR